MIKHALVTLASVASMGICLTTRCSQEVALRVEFSEAVARGDCDRLQQLLERGIEVNARNINEAVEEVLSDAADKRYKTVSLLLYYGAPMHKEVQEVYVVRSLWSPTTVKIESKTALAKALESGNERLIRMLITRGADIGCGPLRNKPNVQGLQGAMKTALIDAQYGMHRCWELLTGEESREELFQRRGKTIEEVLIDNNSMPRDLARLTCEFADVSPAQTPAGPDYQAGAAFADLLADPEGLS